MGRTVYQLISESLNGTLHSVDGRTVKKIDIVAHKVSYLLI